MDKLGKLKYIEHTVIMSYIYWQRLNKKMPLYGFVPILGSLFISDLKLITDLYVLRYYQ